MSAEAVHTLVTALLGLKPPTLETLQAALGAALRQTGQNNHWTMYEFTLPGGPFGGGEARLGRDGARALVSLHPREGAPLTEAGLDLKAYGPVASIDINPQIPPEGTDAYVFRQPGVKLAFQLTHQSRRLRTLVVEWAPAA